jgi:hypothetical protein
MTIPRFTDPPDAPIGTSWCQACLYRGKGHMLVTHQAEIQKLLADRDDKAEQWFSWDRSIKLYEARYRGVAIGMEFLGEMFVCFSCLAGFGGERTSLLDPRAGGSLPPGFLKGRG